MRHFDLNGQNPRWMSTVTATKKNKKKTKKDVLKLQKNSAKNMFFYTSTQKSCFGGLGWENLIP